jgi:hypothetical protein
MPIDKKLSIHQAVKNGNSQAISALLNRHLQPKGITAKVSVKDGCLQIMLEAANALNQKALVSALKKYIDSLDIESIQNVQIYAKKTGEEIPTWNDSFETKKQIEDPNVEGTEAIPTVEIETSQISIKVDKTVNQVDFSLLELARNGETKTISELIKSSLQQTGVKVRTTLSKGLLQVVIVSNQVPKQDYSVEAIPKLVMNFKSTLIQKMKVIGMQEIEGSTNSNIFWVQEFIIDIPVGITEQKDEEYQAVNNGIRDKFIEQDDHSKALTEKNKLVEMYLKSAGAVSILLFISLLLIYIIRPKENSSNILVSSTPTPIINSPTPFITATSTPFITATSKPTIDFADFKKEQEAKETAKAKMFLSAYLDEIVNGGDGIAFFCDADSESTFFSPRNYKILKVDMFDTVGNAIVRLDSSNKGGSQITRTWQFYYKRGTPQYSSLIGKAGEYGLCLNLISEKN